MGILGVVISLVLIVYLVRKELNVGWAMVLGALVISLFSKMSLGDTYQAFKTATFSNTFIELAMVVFLISLLGYIMKMTGALDLMISSLFSILGGGKLLMMAMPSLIGLLTVPGGAILSAPMVGESGEKMGLTSHQKAAVNIFFRHIWYPIYPLYPALLVASRLTGVSATRIMVMSFPVVIAAVITAMNTIFIGSKQVEKEKDINRVQALKGLILSMLPLIATLTLALVLKLSFPMSVLVGIIIALVNLTGEGKNILEVIIKRLKTMIIPGINLKMVVSVFGIIVFGEVLSASSVLSDLMNTMVSLGLPIAILAVLSALITGLITGSNTASLGITVPVFLPLIIDNPSPYVLLIFMGSLLGYVLSPMHLCLILTKDHFKCQYKEMYTYFIPPIIAMTAVTTIIALALIYM